MLLFLGLLLLYIPTALLGYLAFGHGATLTANIIDNLSRSTVILFVEFFFFLHCITVIFIVLCPALLDLEELFRVPKSKLYLLAKLSITLCLTFCRLWLASCCASYLHSNSNHLHWWNIAVIRSDSRSDRLYDHCPDGFCFAAHFLLQAGYWPKTVWCLATTVTTV